MSERNRKLEDAARDAVKLLDRTSRMLLDASQPTADSTEVRRVATAVVRCEQLVSRLLDLLREAEPDPQVCERHGVDREECCMKDRS